MQQGAVLGMGLWVPPGAAGEGKCAQVPLVLGMVMHGLWVPLAAAGEVHMVQRYMLDRKNDTRVLIMGCLWWPNCNLKMWVDVDRGAELNVSPTG